MQSSNNFSADGSAGLAALGSGSGRSTATEARRRRFIRIVAVIVSLSVVLLGVGLVRRGVDGAAYANEAPLPVVSPALTRNAAPPSAASPLPAPAPAPAPASSSGTLVRATKKRTLVDGTLVRAPSLAVKCGVHTVKIGAAKPRTVDVPCGGELTLR